MIDIAAFFTKRYKPAATGFEFIPGDSININIFNSKQASSFIAKQEQSQRPILSPEDSELVKGFLDKDQFLKSARSAFQAFAKWQDEFWEGCVEDCIRWDEEDDGDEADNDIKDLETSELADGQYKNLRIVKDFIYHLEGLWKHPDPSHPTNQLDHPDNAWMKKLNNYFKY